MTERHPSLPNNDLLPSIAFGIAMASLMCRHLVDEWHAKEKRRWARVSEEACHAERVLYTLGGWARGLLGQDPFGTLIDQLDGERFVQADKPTAQDKAIFFAVRAMHEDAVEHHWGKRANEWPVLNRLREAIGFPTVEPVDEPTAEYLAIPGELIGDLTDE